MTSIYINFWHLKSMNGMFYFGCDYGKLLVREFDCVFVCRKGVLKESNFPIGFFVIELSVASYIIFCLRSIILRRNVFCVTVHAIPFLKRQIVTLHDIYPFRSRAKKFLLWVMLSISGANIGVINQSISPAFLTTLKLTSFILIPNILPDLQFRPQVGSGCSAPLRIGLAGTDSKKKNYEDFLSKLIIRGDDFSVYIYGTDTDYLRGIFRDYQRSDLYFISSDEVSLEDFVAFKIDVLVSVARNEGFCRPVALSVLMERRILLLDDPVFLEFYKNHAEIYSCTEDLIVGLFGPQSSKLDNVKGFKNSNMIEVEKALSYIKIFYA